MKHLTGRIVGGELSPGSRFPTQEEIICQFNASPMTVQSAIHQLKQDGFVETRGRQGTYVSVAPPHLTSYAVVFPFLIGEPGWSKFAGALNDVMFDYGESHSGAIIPELRGYFGTEHLWMSEDMPTLAASVVAHRVAGLIFTARPHIFANTPILDEPGIPRVAIMSKTDWNIPAVHLDNASFREKALDHLVGLNCKRLAVISTPSDLEPAIFAGDGGTIRK